MNFLTEFGITLDNGQLADLHRRTEGWIAPVALAVSALDSDSRDDAEELFRRMEDFDGNIYAFFAQEVYLRLDPELRWLLRRVCLTRTVHSGTVSAVCGRTDGGQVLRDLSQANTFLTSLDEGKGTYRFHSMFSEFLKKRLIDEEGPETLREVELSLARYYEKDHNWLPAVEHFIKSKEFSSAVRCLERIAPLTLKLGYGYALISLIDEIPGEWRRESVVLHDFVGQAALQIGNPRKALPPLKRAQELYNASMEYKPENRLRYLIAEARFEIGELNSKEFVAVLEEVVEHAYSSHDVFVSVQAELRAISLRRESPVPSARKVRQLIQRTHVVTRRITEGQVDNDSLRARVLLTEANLTWDLFVVRYRELVTRTQIRQSMGHPLSVEERIVEVRKLLQMSRLADNKFGEAEALVKSHRESDWAEIRLQRLNSLVNTIRITRFIRAVDAPDSNSTRNEFVEEDELLRSHLVSVKECADVFHKFMMVGALAGAYLDAANIYDLLGESDSRDDIARDALKIATRNQLAPIADRARSLLDGTVTKPGLQRFELDGSVEARLASLTRDEQDNFVETVLAAYSRDASIELMREAVRVGIEDLVGVAKQRMMWCREIELTEDLRHTESLETLYRETPFKRVSCKLLGHVSQSRHRSFQEVWPGFKGMYCLGCACRRPVDPKK